MILHWRATESTLGSLSETYQSKGVNDTTVTQRKVGFDNKIRFLQGWQVVVSIQKPDPAS